MQYSPDNQTAIGLTALGVEKNSKQMIISINRQGQVEYKGYLDKKRDLKEFERAVLQEESTLHPST